MNNSTITNNTEHYDNGAELWRHFQATRAAKITGTIAISVVAIILNALVIYPVCRQRHMKKNINYFIANMAVSDTMIVLLNGLLDLSELFRQSFAWPMDGIAAIITCKLGYYLSSMVLLVSPLTLLFITVERLRAVSSMTIVQLSPRGRGRLLALTWLIPIMVYSPFLYLLETVHLAGMTYCIVTKVSVYKVIALVFVILYLAIYLLTATAAVFILLKLANLHVFQDLTESQRKARAWRVKNAVTMVMCSLVTFVVLTTPLHAYSFVKTFYPSLRINTSVNLDIRYTCSFLIYLNSVASACIYFIFIKDFRAAITSLISRNVNRVTSMRMGTVSLWHTNQQTTNM